MQELVTAILWSPKQGDEVPETAAGVDTFEKSFLVLLGVRCCVELVWGIIAPVPPDRPRYYYCPHARMGKLRHRESCNQEVICLTP